MTERAVRVAAAALVILVAAWAGMRVHDRIQSGWGAHSAGRPTPVGEASLPLPADLADQPVAGLLPAAVKIPEHLPDFSLKDLDGKPTPVARWRGKSLAINFWATWCAPCRREIPMLEALSAEWADRGVTVLGIAVDHAQAVSSYARLLKIAYPVLSGEQDALDVAEKLGVASPVFPFTVFCDNRGEVVAIYVGELHRAQAELILSVVQHVNRDQLALGDARHDISVGLHSLPASPTSDAG